MLSWYTSEGAPSITDQYVHDSSHVRYPLFFQDEIPCIYGRFYQAHSISIGGKINIAVILVCAISTKSFGGKLETISTIVIHAFRRV